MQFPLIQRGGFYGEDEAVFGERFSHRTGLFITVGQSVTIVINIPLTGSLTWSFATCKFSCAVIHRKSNQGKYALTTKVFIALAGVAQMVRCCSEK